MAKYRINERSFNDDGGEITYEKFRPKKNDDKKKREKDNRREARKNHFRNKF